MRIACTGDWHMFAYTDFSKTYMVRWNKETMRYERELSEDAVENAYCKPMNSRLFNVLNGICDMRDYCFENHIHNMLVAGDIFHKRETIDVSVYNPTYRVLETFEPKKIKVYAIAGNHDQIDNSQQPLSSLHPLKEIINVIEKPEILSLYDYEEPDDPYEGDDSEYVVALPFSKDKQFVLDSMTELRAKLDSPRDAILLCHLGITGGLVGSGQYSMKDEYGLKELMYDKWKYLVAGHYHQPQLLEYNSIYTGSPLQNNFGDELKGEDGYNGFFVIDTEKRWDIRFVPIIAPRFITLTADELDGVNPDIFNEHYVRIKSTAQDSDKVKDLLEKSVDMADANVRLELEKEYVTEHRSDIGVSNTFEETVDIYATEKYSGEQELSKIKEMGLTILREATVGGE